MSSLFHCHQHVARRRVHPVLRPDTPFFATLRLRTAPLAHMKMATITTHPSGARRLRVRRKGNDVGAFFPGLAKAEIWAWSIEGQDRPRRPYTRCWRCRQDVQGPYRPPQRTLCRCRQGAEAVMVKKRPRQATRRGPVRGWPFGAVRRLAAAVRKTRWHFRDKVGWPVRSDRLPAWHRARPDARFRLARGPCPRSAPAWQAYRRNPATRAPMPPFPAPVRSWGARCHRAKPVPGPWRSAG